MGRRIKKHRKKVLALTSPYLKDQTETSEGQFPLNSNESDRVRWLVTVNRDGVTRRINTISYEIKIDEKWVWIVRYDDHDGFGEFHKHERLSIESEANGYAAVAIGQKLSKHQQKQWAIDDIRKNYLEYRENFLKKNGLAIY